MPNINQFTKSSALSVRLAIKQIAYSDACILHPQRYGQCRVQEFCKGGQADLRQAGAIPDKDRKTLCVDILKSIQPGGQALWGSDRGTK